ncbi:RNA polymerase sigma factor [Pedobacter steynii]
MREQSFVKLIHEHQGIIHKICRLYRDSKEDREDLFQEIAYQLWKSFDSYKGEAKISTWMYRIALNTAIASFRKRNLMLNIDQNYQRSLILKRVMNIRFDKKGYLLY